MARPREFDREQALDRGMRAFWSRGYEATSLDDLLKATDLSRSSFYAAFGSKHEMLLTSLDRYIDTVLAALLEALEQGSARSAIRHNIERVLAQLPAGKTCFLHNCAIEVARRDSQSRVRVRRGIERLEQGYHDAVVRGQHSGEFRKDGDARTLAKYLVAN